MQLDFNCKMTAHNDKIVGEGLTYDDVLLVPAFSDVLPREVSIQTKFTRNISINVPIISAAMDTVTESAMAIAMAKAGGIGIIHRNLPIDEQVTHVKLVKNVGLAGAAVGVGDDGFARAKALIEAGVDVVDVPYLDLENMDGMKIWKQKLPTNVIYTII